MADLPVPPWLWALLGAWVLGSIPVGYVLVKARTGADVRAGGSGTVGARNVARVLGWRGFVATLLGDLLKGLGAVLLAQQVGPQELWVAVAALLACVVAMTFRRGLGGGGATGLRRCWAGWRAWTWKCSRAWVWCLLWPCWRVRRGRGVGIFRSRRTWPAWWRCWRFPRWRSGAGGAWRPWGSWWPPWGSFWQRCGRPRGSMCAVAGELPRCWVWWAGDLLLPFCSLNAQCAGPRGR
jgi:hypothetical protein